MDLTHDFTVPAGTHEAWAAFNHLELIASCFPGASLTSVNEQDFTGTLKIKLGPAPLAYVGTGRFVERHLGGRHVVIHAEGNDRRGRGTAVAKITLSFGPSGEATDVHAATSLTFTGQPAQLAPGVVEDAADRLVAQFVEAITIRFREGLGAEALAADADPTYTTPLGQPASSSSKTYTYNPPPAASQTDYDVFVKVAPMVAKRVGPALVGAVAVLWVVRRIRRR